MKRALILIAIYLSVGIITFGKVASTPIACRDDVTGEWTDLCPSRLKSANGFAAAVFWPFYWSWEAWSWAR